MKKLTFTKNEAVRLHRKMWRELAETGVSIKPKLSGVLSDCFACHYDYEKGKIEFTSDCAFCPFIWPEEAAGLDRKECQYMCNESDGLYYKWRNTESPEERKALALQIANLPIHKG
jgi:hypothetical protein